MVVILEKERLTRKKLLICLILLLLKRQQTGGYAYQLRPLTKIILDLRHGGVLPIVGSYTLEDTTVVYLIRRLPFSMLVRFRDIDWLPHDIIKPLLNILDALDNIHRVGFVLRGLYSGDCYLCPDKQQVLSLTGILSRIKALPTGYLSLEQQNRVLLV